jgi:hypothetical protein
VWVLEAGNLKEVDLRLGLSDGLSTEIVDGPLAEGSSVIVGLAAADSRGTGLPRFRIF